MNAMKVLRQALLYNNLEPDCLTFVVNDPKKQVREALYREVGRFVPEVAADDHIQLMGFSVKFTHYGK